MITDNKQGHIVFVALKEKVIGNRFKPGIINRQAC